MEWEGKRCPDKLEPERVVGMTDWEGMERRPLHRRYEERRMATSEEDQLVICKRRVADRSFGRNEIEKGEKR